MKIAARVTAVLATLGVALGLVVVAQSSASAATSYQAYISWQASKSTIRYKSSVTYSGVVYGYNSVGQKAAMDGGSVSLQKLSAGTSTWRTIATKPIGTTSPDTGKFSFTTVGTVNAKYRIYYRGYTDPGGSYTFTTATSTSKSMWVARNLHDNWLKSGGKFYLRGNVDPGYAYSGLIVQRKTCASCAWRYYKTTKTNKYGAYNTVLAKPGRGSYYYRAYARTSKSYILSKSRYEYRIYVY